MAAPIPEEFQNFVRQELAKVKATKGDAFCPDCFEKDMLAQFTTRDHKAALEKLEGQVSQLTAEVDKLGKEAHAIPSVGDFVKHCTDGKCSEHNSEWTAFLNRFKNDYLAGLTKDQVAELARLKGVDLMPDKIVIGPELSKRLGK